VPPMRAKKVSNTLGLRVSAHRRDAAHAEKLARCIPLTMTSTLVSGRTSGPALTCNSGSALTVAGIVMQRRERSLKGPLRACDRASLERAAPERMRRLGHRRSQRLRRLSSIARQRSRPFSVIVRRCSSSTFDGGGVTTLIYEASLVFRQRPNPRERSRRPQPCPRNSQLLFDTQCVSTVLNNYS
jgi:hypothetical protein